MALVGLGHCFLEVLGGEGLAPGLEVLAVVGLGSVVGVVEVDESLQASIQALDYLGVGPGEVVDLLGVVVQME